MSVPDWIEECCGSTTLYLEDTCIIDQDQLNELSSFLESQPTNEFEEIDTIVLSPKNSQVTMEAVFNALRKNSKNHTVRIEVSKQQVVGPNLNEWIIGLNQAPTSTTLVLDFYEVVSIQPWIHSLQLNTNVVSLQITSCRLGTSDVTELIELLSSNYTITELAITLNSPSLMDTDDFSRLCTYLKSDNFIKSFIVEFDSFPVREFDSIALARMIKVNNTLTWVEIRGSEITSSGQSALADALIYNTELTYLYLPSTNRDEGFHQVIKVRLQHNSDLIHNPLTLLLHQAELTKETDRRKLIKQMKLDVFIQTRSTSRIHKQTKLDEFIQQHSTLQTKSVHRLKENEEDGQPVKKKLKVELSTDLSLTVKVQTFAVTVTLNKFDVEYLRVNLDFHESFAGMSEYHGLKFKVTQIERITNLVLKDQFDQSYQYFKAHNYHSTQPIRSVYHSTKPENIPHIIESNLSLAKAGSVTDSGWFGRGMYFSPHADYTLMYYSTGRFKRVVAGDSGKILQFDILPGRMFRMRDVKIGGERTLYYDSHVSPNEFEYVIFDSRHILPRYVISFDVVQGAGKKFHGSFEQFGPQHPKSALMHTVNRHQLPAGSTDATTMKVVIQTLLTKSYSMVIGKKETVAQLKGKIHTELGLGEPEQQKLIYLGKILMNEQTMESAQIKPGQMAYKALRDICVSVSFGYALYNQLVLQMCCF